MIDMVKILSLRYSPPKIFEKRESLCFCKSKSNATSMKCISFLSSRLLDSEREALADVPAVYFVQPTDENIRRICQVLE